MNANKVRLEVVEFTKVAGRNVVAVKVLSGEPSSSALLQSENNGIKWKVKGSAFIPAEKWEVGLRGLILEAEDEDVTLNKGEKLYS